MAKEIREGINTVTPTFGDTVHQGERIPGSMSGAFLWCPLFLCAAEFVQLLFRPSPHVMPVD
jgi:hypothetical protein